MKYALIFSFCFLCCLAKAEWNIDEPNKAVPQSLKGEIFGRDLTKYEATWNSVTLNIASEQISGGWPDAEIIIFISCNEEKTEWYVTPKDTGFDRPHIHMKFAKEGANFPGTLMFIEEYSLYLKVIKKTESIAVFQIHLSLPDYKKSYLYGTVEAKIKK